MMNVTFISLGCAKNLVDSEYILGLLKQDKEIAVIDNIEKSDAIFINTCGFIQDAKKEAIDMIFDVLSLKKEKAYLIVIGCLAKRYKKELYKEIPEIDLIIGVDEYATIGKQLNHLFHLRFPKTYDPLKRSLSNPLPVAYLKIGEGCSNKCAYCAIPLIRGDYYSYPKEQIIEDAKRLISLGKKEIVIIAQDPTRYGKDLYENYSIEELIDELAKLDKNVYYRILYLYPDRISDKLIYLFKIHSNIMPYFDIPIQHSSNKILVAMKRSGTREKYLEVISKIQKEIPSAILRTTLIVGFPGEDENDFEDLKNFIQQVRFDHLGVFPFSDEEDTLAHDMKTKVPLKIAKQRAKEIMRIQKQISLEKNKKRINEIHDVLIEDFDGNNYYGRSYLYAPDAEDGNFIIHSNQKLIIGEYRKVKIKKVTAYDVKGEL